MLAHGSLKDSGDSAYPAILAIWNLPDVAGSCFGAHFATFQRRGVRAGGTLDGTLGPKI
jgi:hypothetical protein